MSIERLNRDLAIIQKLSDLPNSTDGLSAEQLKAKFDESGLEIQKWINEVLLPGLRAENLGFTASPELNAENIQAAVELVHSQIRAVSAGSIANGAVSKEKLAEALLERVFGGRVWAGFDKPTAADNPGTEFPVGQLWLRPAHGVQNAITGNWSATGCTAEMEGYTLTMTGNQTVSTIHASQSIPDLGQAGDRVYVVLDVADRDGEITALTGSFDGGEAFALVGNGVYETVLNGSSLTVQVTAQWPAASLANGSVILQNLTVVNPDALLRKWPGTHDRKDWKGWLRETVPFDTAEMGRELYVQVQPGIWQLFDREVFPVGRGGTGVSEIGDGEILYGRDGGFAKLEKPGEASILEFRETPEWVPVSALAGHGYARVTAGSYVGTGAERTITLPVAPKLLVIESSGVSSIFLQGSKQYEVVDGTHINGGSAGYSSGFTLTGNTLVSYVSGTGSIQGPHLHSGLNENGKTYPWVAIY